MPGIRCTLNTGAVAGALLVAAAVTEAVDPYVNGDTVSFPMYSNVATNNAP